MKTDLKGQIFGRLTVIKATNDRKGRKIVWQCQCNCPQKPFVYVATDKLRGGDTRSCGCLRRETTAQRRTTHGATKGLVREPLYIILASAKRRCYNKNCKDYPDYGGRDIDIYKPWHKYENFRDYMLALPDCPVDAQIPGSSLKYEIDRIRNDEGYKPGNVRWATRKTQNNNKRNNRVLIVTTKKTKFRMTLAEAIDKYGKTNYDTTHQRLLRGWSLNEAILTPVLKT